MTFYLRILSRKLCCYFLLVWKTRRPEAVTMLHSRGGVLENVLGLEASSPRKLACLRLEDSTIFWNVKIEHLKNFCEDLFFFFWRSPEKFLWRPFFFWRALALVSLALSWSIPVLCLERVCPRKGCPWPRIFFVSLASSLVSSTPPLLHSSHVGYGPVINTSWFSTIYIIQYPVFVKYNVHVSSMAEWKWSQVYSLSKISTGVGLRLRLWWLVWRL